jgi:hypothetical protein
MPKIMLEDEWPQPSSPTSPPVVNWYFGRVIGETLQETFVCNFRNYWQLGVFLRHVLKDAEDIELTEGPWGTTIDYIIPRERDPDGRPVKIIRMRGRFGVKSYDEIMAVSEKFADREIPYKISEWVRLSRGSAEWQSMRDYDAKIEPKNMPVSPTPPPERPAHAPRVKNPSKPRAERTAGAVTLAVLCAGTGIEPRDVRVELRKQKVEKPPAGWEFDENDGRIFTVKKIIEALKGKK